MALTWTPLQTAFGRLLQMEVKFKGKSVELIKSEAPKQCPHCKGAMQSHHLGCDGDFCFGVVICAKHPLEAYPYAQGHH